MLTILILHVILPTADVVTDINLMVRLYDPPPGCRYYSETYDGFNLTMIHDACIKNPVTFCSREGNRQHCASFPTLATALLTPFLLNYIVCFYTFFRLTTHRKKYLFIFPMLNLYPQYGKTHSS